MKKFIILLLILCALFIGMELGATAKDEKSRELEQRIDEFEEQIKDPNNSYKPGRDNKNINPNITNDIAKTGEKAITSIFDFTLGIIESVLIKN